ncbi:SDR family oxidoreductase [Streptomyces sp. NPDC046324]|uniref:SDR family oxidoreductase n=1 Tax=Streptomyces sp. NPDC046324 TaxID=3154915 RepID=UPI0033F4D668
MTKYAGKKAVISGGTHGMGLAVARALVAEGAEVVVTGRDEANLAAARDALGPGAHVVRCDVTDLAEIGALGRAVEERLGGVDFLFVNAGYAKLEPFELVTEAVYDRIFAVNTKGAYFTVQRLAPLLREGGAVVFTTSIAHHSGTAGMSAYAGAKAAVRSFAQVFAAELLPRGIRVNTVGPGFIKTPSMGVEASAEERAVFEKIGDEITPMKRHGSVEEISRAVLFLAFDATFTTGTEITVDGGLTEVLTLPAP